MAETRLDWPVIFDAIDDELANVMNSDGKPAFVDVIQGEPLGLPLGGPYACFYYLGREDSREGRMTLGNVMYTARIQVMAFWPIQPDRATVGALEADIATVDTNIRRAFRGNSTINSEVTDLDILNSIVDFGAFPAGTQQIYRSLSMELRLENLEGEPISA